MQLISNCPSEMIFRQWPSSVNFRHPEVIDDVGLALHMISWSERLFDFMGLLELMLRVFRPYLVLPSSHRAVPSFKPKGLDSSSDASCLGWLA